MFVWLHFGFLHKNRGCLHFKVSLAIWDLFFLEYATILFLSSGPEFYFYYFVDLLDHATDQLAFRRITRTVSVSLRVSDTGACDKSRPLGDLLTLSPRGWELPDRLGLSNRRAQSYGSERELMKISSKNV